MLPSSSSAWPGRRGSRTSRRRCAAAAAPVLPVVTEPIVSLKPNDRPLRKRRLNDSCSEWYVRQPRAGALRDRAVAAERAHLVGRRPPSRPASRSAPASDPGSAGRNAAPKSTALMFDALDDVVAVLADVRDVERDRPRQRHLHAAVPLRSTTAGSLVVLEHVERRRRLRSSARRAERLQLRRSAPSRSRSVGGLLHLRDRSSCRSAGRRTGRRRRAARSLCWPVTS